MTQPPALVLTKRELFAFISFLFIGQGVLEDGLPRQANEQAQWYEQLTFTQAGNFGTGIIPIHPNLAIRYLTH